MESIRKNIRRIVVKFGTGILTKGIGELDTDRIFHFCDQLAAIRKLGIEVLVVSSGSIGLGMGQLKLKKRPTELAVSQACAAIGQSILMNIWRDGFARHGFTVAQVLLTHDAVRGRTRHINTRDMIDTLLDRSIIPIINENDSVSVQEIEFGDNDTLSALVTSFAKADQLFIVSTAPGLIDMQGTGEIIPVVEEITPQVAGLAEGTDSPTAVGGMISKISAARLATRSGAGVFITSGRRENGLIDWFSGPQNSVPGTLFLPSGTEIDSHKRWLAFFESPGGTIHVDAGAREALETKGSSLLAIGVTEIDGSFKKKAVVNVSGPDGEVFARGVSQFGSRQLKQIRGLGSEKIQDIFPKCTSPEVMHRDTLVIL
ncbi:MAG: glutamate 5-kinase [Opitutales bacterium]